MSDAIYHEWNGLVFGEKPAVTYTYGLVSADGLEDVDMSGGSIDGGGIDGRAIAPLWAESGGWVTVVSLWGADAATWSALRDDLRAATTPTLDRYTEIPYDMVYGDEDTRTRFARVTRRMIPTDEQYLARRETDAQIGYTANDPFTYGPAVTETGWGDGDFSTFTATGWVPSKRWEWIVHGPVTNPSLTLAVAGFDDVVLRFNGAVPDGSDLIVDSTPHRLATTVGGVDCYGSFDDGTDGGVAPFFALPPGEQTVTYNTGGGAGDSDFTWRTALL